MEAGDILIKGRWHTLLAKAANMAVRRVTAVEHTHVQPFSQVDVPASIIRDEADATGDSHPWLAEPYLLRDGVMTARTVLDGAAPTAYVRVINDL